MSAEILSDFDFKLLSTLARFEYLTTEQVQRLGLSPSLHWIQTRVRKMEQTQRPLIGALDFGSVPTLGRLHRLIYLTHEGAAMIAEHTNISPRYPKNARLFAHDYKHRIHTIDTVIAAYKWAESNGGTMPLCLTYYGQGRQGDKGRPLAASHVAWTREHEPINIVPDAILKTALPSVERLYCLEITNGDKWQNDKGKIVAYIKAFEDKAFEKAFNYDYAPRVIFAYENTAPLLRLMDWARTAPKMKQENYEKRFLFGSIEEIRNGDFETALLNI